MLTRRSLVLLLAGTATLPTPPASAQKTWKTYRNERFGTGIEYPADRFHAMPPPINGDGLKFEASDGADFTVSAIRNALEETLADLEQESVKKRDAGETVTYSTRGSNWLVVSGTRGDVVFYEHRLLSHRNEIINSFIINYPVALKSVYDPITARMSKSLRAGKGYDTRRP